ncbi:hypothetical protein HQ393_04570 [Chitinibacter bivalviorum]|uniref:Uncharacterized protein n=1 Tax=Chitinibacter bivalviorum TaxID=2739434 RepID=A0A7H9BG74_9NEIS|nr:hypothetical protein [Chitinibacter bivalviorum]QLG87585.1 hypothetical protein HQ393_04570 [Chitinibacter bivalviorum]
MSSYFGFSNVNNVTVSDWTRKQYGNGPESMVNWEKTIEVEYSEFDSCQVGSTVVITASHQKAKELEAAYQAAKQAEAEQVASLKQSVSVSK